MTFNIRLDGEERDPANHFTRRIERLRATFGRWNAQLVGLQEPYGGQAIHLMSVLPTNIRLIGRLAPLGDARIPKQVSTNCCCLLFSQQPFCL